MERETAPALSGAVSLCSIILKEVIFYTQSKINIKHPRYFLIVHTGEQATGKQVMTASIPESALPTTTTPITT